MFDDEYAKFNTSIRLIRSFFKINAQHYDLPFITQYILHYDLTNGFRELKSFPNSIFKNELNFKETFTVTYNLV